MTDCITKLTEARQALHDLMIGEAVVSVSHNGTETSYTQATVNQLRKYIRELEAECGETDADGLNPSRRGSIKFVG
ncbi:MAG: gpW family protein [Candidatus Thiodiazotropha sp. (ex Monitilora ramsayi)]|nr:gpW family protein [Candidatus Thiodiazotropha sp. (ex Monitilora ramsayi)]